MIDENVISTDGWNGDTGEEDEGKQETIKKKKLIFHFNMKPKNRDETRRRSLASGKWGCLAGLWRNWAIFNNILHFAHSLYEYSSDPSSHPPTHSLTLMTTKMWYDSRELLKGAAAHRLNRQFYNWTRYVPSPRTRFLNQPLTLRACLTIQRCLQTFLML